MGNRPLRRAVVVVEVAAAIAGVYFLGYRDGDIGEAPLAGLVPAVWAQGGETEVSPVKARERDYYAPASEALGRKFEYPEN